MFITWLTWFLWTFLNTETSLKVGLNNQMNEMTKNSWYVQNILTRVFSLTCKPAICSWSFLKLGNLLHVFCCWIFITSSFNCSKMLVHNLNSGSILNNSIKTTHPFRLTKFGCKVNRTWLLLYWQVAWTISLIFSMRLSEKAAQSFLLVLNF